MSSLMGMVAGVTANFGPFCSKDVSSGVSSFLERLITHLSWMLEEVEGVTAVLEVLVVLEVIFEDVVEDLEMRCLSFLIWVFLYCMNVFSLLLKIMFHPPPMGVPSSLGLLTQNIINTSHLLDLHLQ